MIADELIAESIGWLATGVVVASFFFVDQRKLRTVQILGALLWLLYGIAIGSLPVIVANVLVFSAATWTTFFRRSEAPLMPPAVPRSVVAPLPSAREDVRAAPPPAEGG